MRQAGAIITATTLLPMLTQSTTQHARTHLLDLEQVLFLGLNGLLLDTGVVHVRRAHRLAGELQQGGHPRAAMNEAIPLENMIISQ